MLDWTAARGSRLAYSCRHCGRRFCHFTILNQGAWAVNGDDGWASENSISDHWFGEQCPRLLNITDDDDRKRLSRLAAQ